jgi:hypothetical protein
MVFGLDIQYLVDKTYKYQKSRICLRKLGYD